MAPLTEGMRLIHIQIQVDTRQSLKLEYACRVCRLPSALNSELDKRARDILAKQRFHLRYVFAAILH